MEDAIFDLRGQFPDVDSTVLKYVHEEVCGKNLEVSIDVLKSMIESNTIQNIVQSLKQGKKLSPQNEQDLSAFISITDTNRETAMRFLENNAWRLEDALHMYFESGMAPTFDIPETLRELFQRMAKEDGEKKVLRKLGILKLASELREKSLCETGDNTLNAAEESENASKSIKTSPSKQPSSGINAAKGLDFDILVLLWIVASRDNSFIVTFDEFLAGMETLGYDTIQDLVEGREHRATFIKTDKQWIDFMKFVFDFVNPTPLMNGNTAASLWRIIYSHQELHYFDQFINYYEKLLEPVSRDTWLGVHHFLSEVKTAEDYDPDDGIYPLLVDNFMKSIGNS